MLHEQVMRRLNFCISFLSFLLYYLWIVLLLPLDCVVLPVIIFFKETIRSPTQCLKQFITQSYAFEDLQNAVFEKIRARRLDFKTCISLPIRGLFCVNIYDAFLTMRRWEQSYVAKNQIFSKSVRFRSIQMCFSPKWDFL